MIHGQSEKWEGMTRREKSSRRLCQVPHLPCRCIFSLPEHALTGPHKKDYPKTLWPLKRIKKKS